MARNKKINVQGVNILTKDKIAELTQLRNDIAENHGMSDIEKMYSSNSFDEMIAQLEEELEEFSKFLIRARIAQPLS